MFTTNTVYAIKSLSQDIVFFCDKYIHTTKEGKTPKPKGWSDRVEKQLECLLDSFNCFTQNVK